MAKKQTKKVEVEMSQPQEEIVVETPIVETTISSCG
jgi:hypothetical protein